MTFELTQAQRTKRSASLLSLASKATLTVLKILVGVATGSVSILADAAHSASDPVASGLTFYSARQADRPMRPTPRPTPTATARRRT